MIETILNKQSKEIENNCILIDTTELEGKEIEILELNGYEVKLFNHNCVKKPYYQIKKK